MTHEAPSARRMGDLQLHTSLVSGVHLGDMHCIPPFAHSGFEASRGGIWHVWWP